MQVEKFHGWTEYFQFAGKLSRFVYASKFLKKCAAHMYKQACMPRVITCKTLTRTSTTVQNKQHHNT